MKCRAVEHSLVELHDGRLDAATELRLHAHLETCAACRERAATWRALLPAMRPLAPPPPSPMRLRRMEVEIERQLANAAGVERPQPSRWFLVGGAVAAAASLVLGATWLLRHPHVASPSLEAAPFAAVTSRIGAVSASARFAAGGRVTIAAGDELGLALESGATLKLIGPASLVLGGDVAHVALRLDDGRLEAQVDHRASDQTFVVTLPDGRIEVRGTRFVVAGKERGSWVRVDEGRVAVFELDGRQAAVGKGETHMFAVPTPSTPPAQPAAERDECSAPKVDCRELTRRARTAMRERRFADTLAIVEPVVHARGACARRPLSCRDEIGYLQAEAFRLGGDLDRAVTAYKALDRKDAPPATRQNALYAAAQLERSQGKLAGARADYERALSAFPAGALREETMLGALETADRAGDANAAVAAARRYLGAFPSGLGTREARRIEAARQASRGSAP